MRLLHIMYSLKSEYIPPVMHGNPSVCRFTEYFCYLPNGQAVHSDKAAAMFPFSLKIAAMEI